MKYVSRMGIPALAELYERMIPAGFVNSKDITVEEDKKHDCLIVTYSEPVVNARTLGVKFAKTKYALKDFEPPVCLEDLGNPSKELYFLYMVNTFGREYLEDYLKYSMGIAVHIPEFKAEVC